MHKSSCQNILSEIQSVKEGNHKVVINRKETSTSSNQNENKIQKYFISFKKPANLADSIKTKKSIIKKAKSVTKKQTPLEAAASNNNNSILKYALPTKNYTQQNLSSEMESPSVEKEASPRKLVPDNSPS